MAVSLHCSRDRSAPTHQAPIAAAPPMPGSAEEARVIDSPPEPIGGSRGWPMFRGHRQRTGAADVRGPRTAALRWVFRTGGRIYADAAVSTDGETIYVASHDGFLYAVTRSGRKQWAFDTGGKIWSSPAIAEDGTLFVGSDSEALFAISPKGEERWRFVTTPPPDQAPPKEDGVRFDVDTSPLILTDGTIVFGANLQLIALYPGTGDLRWAFTAGQGRAKIFSSPAASPDGTLFFGTQGNWFLALNSAGEHRWSHQTGDDNDSTPVVDPDGRVYMASADGTVRAFTSDGNQLWQRDIGSSVRAPLSLSHNRTLYVSTYGREPAVLALSSATGDELWRFTTEPGEGDFFGIQSGVTTDLDEYVYFGGRDRWVYCLSPSGEPVWKYETGDQVDASPILGPDGTLYVGSDDGRLYAFGPDER